MPTKYSNKGLFSLQVEKCSLIQSLFYAQPLAISIIVQSILNLNTGLLILQNSASHTTIVQQSLNLKTGLLILQSSNQYVAHSVQVRPNNQPGMIQGWKSEYLMIQSPGLIHMLLIQWHLHSLELIINCNYIFSMPKY